MYAVHYGFREKPFALSPDPRYLFLSASHREVLGHLVYGIEQGEGFMAISGEVGTGKTTLCRTLLARLGSSCEIAFLFNPTLGPTDLIKAINGELGLSTFGDSRAELIDVLNTFLLDRHAEGRRVLVIIDEAQNLPVETLEQLRLLSNLETHTAKLLQIVLIGQPELDVKLATPELRQLRQRISVWWQLGPLGPDETRQYVEHRMRIAGATQPIFSHSALALVHRSARGVPRIVNLLCDRALLRGYAEGLQQIGRGTVRAVVREVGRRPRRWRIATFAWIGIGCLAAAGAALWLLHAGGTREAAAPPHEDSISLPPVAAARPGAPAALPAPALPAPLAPRHDVPGDDVLGALLSLQAPEPSFAAAGAAALSLWHLEGSLAGSANVAAAELALHAAGLETLRLPHTDLTQLHKLDLPALLVLEAKDGGPRLALLRRLGAAHLDLEGVVPEQSVRIAEGDLLRHWKGEALIPWRDYAGLPEKLGPGDAGPPVAWVQDALARLAYYAGPANGHYDARTREAVTAFQRGAGVEADGRVGALTKLALYRSLPDYALPLLATADARAPDRS